MLHHPSRRLRFLLGQHLRDLRRFQAPGRGDRSQIRPTVALQRPAQSALAMRVQQHLPPARLDQLRQHDRDRSSGVITPEVLDRPQQRGEHAAIG